MPPNLADNQVALKRDLHVPTGDSVARRPADTTVPYQWSVDTAHPMDAAGLAVVPHTEQGVGHVPPDATVFTTQSANFPFWVLDLTHAPR